MKRILTMLMAVVMVLGMLPVTTFAAFDTENFVGIVLTVADETFKVEMYSGITSTKTLMTPVHTEGNAYYYEVAVGSYCYIAKPVSGSSHYKIRKNFYVTADMAATKTVWDVTPPVRTSTGWDYTEVQCYADIVMEKAFPSSPDLWPEYAELLKTPALTIPRTEHQMTTQTEMMDYINGLDTKGDDMYVFTLGKGAGPSGQPLDIPVVFFTKTDLSGVTTWEEAADLVCSNGKLTVMYQAQIHGDEPATGEAALAMLKAFNGSYGAGLLGNMNICVMPRLNVYGAYRADRLVYANGQYIDPNRDFLQLQGQEVVLRTQIFQRLEPEICFDTHEYIVHTEYTNVDMHDMQLSTNFSVKSTDDFCDTALTLCYEAFDRAKENNLSYDWYSNAITGYNANIGTCNVAYRGSLVFLTETQGKYGGSQQLERRMMGHISMVTGVLDYVNEHTDAVQQVVDEQRQVIVDRGLTYDESDIIVLKSSYSDREEHYINGQRIHTASGVISDSLFLGHIYDVVDRSRVAPTAYVIPAGESWNAAVLEKLSQHGIAYTQLPAGTIISLQQYLGTVKETTLTEEKPVSFPNGAYVMTMAQEDAYILALLMEPDVNDLAGNKGTFAQMGLISAENEKFPIYRYIQDLNSDAFIDYTVASAAPAGLTAEAVTAIGGTGKITGLDATKIYEYRAADAEEYTPVAAGSTEIAGLPLGEYLVRFAAAQDVLPSADALVTVGYDLDAYIVYVDGTNGTKTNDAYTEATAASTYTVAKEQLDLLMKYAPAGTTGVVKILGTYNMTKTSAGMSSLSAHDYPLLITGGTLIYKNTGSDQKWLRMGGDTTFDNITIKPGSNSSAYFLCGNGHKLTIGPNVTSLANGSYYFNIMGGMGEYSNDTYAAQTDLTIQSGTWRYVYAGGYVSGVTGTAKAQLSNCSVARICGSHNGHILGDLYLSLDNVTVRTNEIYCGNTQKNNVSGNVTLVLGENINAANIYAGSSTAGNVGGTVTIIADGVDLTKTTIHGKANNTTGTIGGLALVLNQGKLSQVADRFITREDATIILGCDQTENATLPACNLDLNGFDANITAAEGATVTVWDSQTDDYTVEDAQGYGILTATGKTVAKDGYIAAGGGFHKFGGQYISTVSLRPSNAGIYYSATVLADEVLMAELETGVAVSLADMPGTDFETDADTLYTKGTRSVLVKNILKGGTEDADRAVMDIYAASYVKLSDGTILVSDTEVAYSLYDILLILKEQDPEAFQSFCSTYAIENWF